MLRSTEPIGILRCSHARCAQRRFKNIGALANHTKAKHTVTQASLPAPKKRRKSYPIRFKALAVRALKMTLMLLCLLCGKSAPSDNTNPSPLCPSCGVKYEQKTHLHKDVARTLVIAEAEQILDREKESSSIRKTPRVARGNLT